MAQLHFRYGSMNASKSLEALRIAYNYEETGRKCLLMTSSLDSRGGVGYISSRVGIKKEAIPISQADDIYNLIAAYMRNNDIATIREFSCIIIDECQFLTEDQVGTIVDIVDYYEIPVICFGLKNDFQNNLFEGSSALLRYADKIEEIKTICVFCEKKATMVLRIKDHLPVYHGEQIQIGGNDSYMAVCRKCYYKPDLSKL